MTTKEQEQLSHAEQNAEAWSDSITAAWEAYGFCAEEGEGKYLSTEAKACLKEHGYDGTNHDVVGEWIEDAMREAPLSVDVRCSSWQAPSDTDFVPDEFQILLSTGGPALRIMGELDQWGQPARCWLEHQDWGTPWARYFSRSADRSTALRWFAGLFYYGEA
jgi:hypothetical protein